MDKLKRIGRMIAPPAQKGADGRAEWGSRTSFVLASMGGAVGLGNILRYPGQVFNNHGAQWFIPYLMALVFLGIPILWLEITIGQAYRGGTVVAYDHISKRAKGAGLAIVYTGYCIVLYYVPLLGWVMQYFRHSFRSPLPWEGRLQEFYLGDVVANGDPVVPEDGGWISYPQTGMVGETAGWVVFTWFIVWLCMFRGVGLLGRVVYFTMGLPIVTAIILIGRGASLPNAWDGIRLYIGTWRGDQLGRGDIWQAACGHIFFSIGVAMGYFTAYASYKPKYANAVQDAVIIAVCNSLYEVLVAFSVFGVIGNIGLFPSPENRQSTFSIGFVTYPAALAQMPGAQFWSVLFFFTVMLLGTSSAFALMEAIITLVKDSAWGHKLSRSLVSSVAVVISCLISLMYCTEFGFWLLDAVDMWTNFMSLFFVAWAECVFSTSIYRHKDVVGQTGWPAFLTYNFGYFGGQIIGLIVGQSTHNPSAAAGVGFGLFICGTLIAVFISKTPDAETPGIWGRNPMVRRWWWLAFYSGNQLTRDLNVTVAINNNWPLPSFWTPVLRYVSAPILAILTSFAYPTFGSVMNDPLHIFGFCVGHIVMLLVVVGLVIPRWFDVFLPDNRKYEGDLPYAPSVLVGTGDMHIGRREEEGSEDTNDKARADIDRGVDDSVQVGKLQ
ncbi:hypothetical protein B0A52_07737 [Exophiala mesophila]|uniref:Uncharacterized protein n=1 Tax=Exophiala mesophila TaxID=212818 RepID=A0A438MXF7_EXOME|nr:hypothetical protein B0A52_07737 [Exophiala mesophila]